MTAMAAREASTVAGKGLKKSSEGTSEVEAGTPARAVVEGGAAGNFSSSPISQEEGDGKKEDQDFLEGGNSSEVKTGGHNASGEGGDEGASEVESGEEGAESVEGKGPKDRMLGEKPSKRKGRGGRPAGRRVGAKFWKRWAKFW